MSKPAPQRPRRTFAQKIQTALRGIKLGIRGQASFAVHFFCAILVLTTAAALGCKLEEWYMLLGCIGLVFTAELFNSALETLVGQLDEANRSRVWPCLDIAAGAVLCASMFAAGLGLMIFVPLLLRTFSG